MKSKREIIAYIKYLNQNGEVAIVSENDKPYQYFYDNTEE